MVRQTHTNGTRAQVHDDEVHVIAAYWMVTAPLATLSPEATPVTVEPFLRPCAVNCAVIVTAHDASGDTGQNRDPGIRTGNREFWPVSSELDGIRFGLANRRLRPLGHLTAAPSIRKISTCVNVSIRRATVFRSATCADLARILNSFHWQIRAHVIALNRRIANDAASQPPESGMVQQIVQ